MRMPRTDCHVENTTIAVPIDRIVICTRGSCMKVSVVNASAAQSVAWAVMAAVERAKFTLSSKSVLLLTTRDDHEAEAPVVVASGVVIAA